MGLSNSLVLPAVMDFNMSVAAGAYAELAELVVPGLQVDGEEARASALIAAMRQLIDDLELPATLAAAGVSAADLEMLAKDAMEQQRLLVNNPTRCELRGRTGHLPGCLRRVFMSKALAPTRDDYPVFYPISTRWEDNDIYGHINNVVYYSYFDTAANRYLIEQGGLDINDGSVVGYVVNSGCAYSCALSPPGRIRSRCEGRQVGDQLGAVRYRYFS